MDYLGGRSPKVNDYQIDKRLEEDASLKFDACYMTYFSNLVKIVRITDKWLQLRGHDVHLFFRDGTRFVIDEKARRKDWDDILIEYLSNQETGRVGWIYRNESDSLAYLFPTKGCYLLDTKMIRKWVHDKTSSFWELPDISAKNRYDGGEYTTISKSVPITTMQELGIIRYHFAI